MPPVDHMKTSLEHLPAGKRAELARIQEIVFEEFRAAVAANPPAIRKAPEILKIVLFGSYARGDWVDEPKSKPDRYQSDFDLLVVVNDKALADEAYWFDAEERLLRVMADATPVSLVAHSLGDVNENLQRGRPFFIDILKDGIALYEKPGHPFRKPKPLAPAAALAEAEAAFARFPQGGEFFDHFTTDLQLGRYKTGALQLHQAAERFYMTWLLVKTLYVPKTHNLKRLRSLAEAEDARFREIWPPGARGGRRAFARLKAAYVDARYSEHYEIEREELVWLGERVAVLRDLVKTLCEERIAALRQEVDRGTEV
jgi:predicted nucleotidyltransferase/HEPN domain-containing protein